MITETTIDYDRIRHSIRRETELRQRGRELELDPAFGVEARDLFRKASELRADRSEYLRRCGLI